MKDIIIYIYNGKEYIMGFDYAIIKKVQMGIDSKLKYYDMDKEIKDFIIKNHLNIIRITLADMDDIMIKTDYSNRLEETRNRVKNDLLYWKKIFEERKSIKMHDRTTFKKF